MVREGDCTWQTPWLRASRIRSWRHPDNMEDQAWVHKKFGQAGKHCANTVAHVQMDKVGRKQVFGATGEEEANKQVVEKLTMSGLCSVK